jgi:NitT/TauT family transport system substrate-binding protein
MFHHVELLPMQQQQPALRIVLRLLLVPLLVLTAAACGDDGEDAVASGNTSTSGGTGSTGDTDGDTGDSSAEPVTLRLGYFPNVTHAPAVYGVAEGVFEETLGQDVTLETATFSTGTEASEAMFAGAIDATFIGPNPAINGFAQSNGEALRIVAGTTSGGAALVVREGIESPDDLAGAALASPSLGNTQDVALRAWLQDEGYETDTSGGGDVAIIPQENADTLTAFQEGQIDGAWVPEPWATRLVLEGGGQVLVDERDLWPDGEFVTTHLIVATPFLEEHPDVVRDLIEGLLDSIDDVNDDAEAAQAVVNDGIEELTTKRLADETIQGAWENLAFTPDPIASSLQESATDAEAVGLLDPVDLDGIYDLTILNELLAERDEEEVEGL